MLQQRQSPCPKRCLQGGRCTLLEHKRKKKNVLVAQLVEQLTLNQWVQGSNPCQDTISRGVAQLASAPRSGRGGRKFESSHPDTNLAFAETAATLAQLVEQRIRNA